MVACGPGVERISDEVGLLFPEARRAIVTSDTLWSPAKAAEFVGRMEAGEIDIVIGTQLITKGYHFPELTLVGVVDADLGLVSGDPRAAERTFQMLQQVTGRAGRGDAPGHAWMEIGGSGMVNARVLAFAGLDPAAWQGFAFGLGIDRIAMLKYGMNDLRAFFDGDGRWLAHYGFSPFDQPTLSAGVGARA